MQIYETMRLDYQQVVPPLPLPLPEPSMQSAVQLNDGSIVVNDFVVDYGGAASKHDGKLSVSDLEAKFKDVPDKYFIIIAHFLSGHINDTDALDRYNGPILKESIKSVYWILLIQYAALTMLGIFANVAIIAYVMYHRLYKDVTQAFIVNLALCHFVQCALVLPISLMVMLIQNWIFGQFLCFFLPMLQDIPLHVAMISHILIAWDRMRWIGNPVRARLPAFVCCCATWLTGMVIALPYPIYTIYVEIGQYVPRLNGIGLCVVNLMDDMHEYMRSLFVLMYCAPTVLLSYLYIRTSQELRPPDGPFAVMMYDQRVDLRNRQRNSSASSVDRSTSGLGSALTTITTHTNGHSSLFGAAETKAARSYDLYSAELDVYREKRKQRNLGSMAATQVVCVCPLMVLRFVRLSMEETYENQTHFDFTYLMFVWIAFLPTVIFPCIYALQILPRAEQERLRGYFRLSSSRFKKSRSGTSSGKGVVGNSTSSRENSIEKDENTNTTQATSSMQNSEGYISGICSCDTSTTRSDLKSKKYQHHSNCTLPHRQNKDKLGGSGSATKTIGKDVRIKKNDVKINILAENKARSATSSANRRGKNIVAEESSGNHRERKLTIESSVDNNSCSNMTSSTYCNGNSSILDDGGMSNFGDGEDSSIVSGMIVQSNGYEKKWSVSGQSMRQKDASFSDCDSFARMNSSSTLDRDLEIIDLLERERSMDIQDMMEREKHGETVRLSGAGERRLLPDIDRIYQRSPKSKHDAYSFDTCATTASIGGAKDSHTMSTTVPSGLDPLQSSNESYSIASTLNSSDGINMLPHDVDSIDEEVPQDFYDKYQPGGDTNMPTEVPTISATPAGGFQYQYKRRLSRKSLHHGSDSMGSHRPSKRDSFNSLNGSDLIAGAFGELDPTQPLTKMSVIENRMRRSSGRNSSFSSSARSSLKSRDYSHGSTHSAHPELDFRENIFAEL